MKRDQKRLHRRSTSISTKLSLVLLVAIVIVFSITGAMNYSYTKSLLVGNIEENLSTKSNALADQVDSMFAEKQAMARQIAANQEITDYLKTAHSRNEARTDPHYESVMQSLNKIVKTDDSIAMVWVASNQGNFLIGNDNLLQDESFDIKSRPWYEPALAEDDVYFTEPYMDQVFGKVILSVMTQIKDGDQTLGFVAMDLFLDDLPQLMQSYKLGKNGYSFLISSDGTILYHPDDKLILDQNLPDLSGDIGNIGKKMTVGEKGLELAKVNDQTEYIGYSPVPATGWSVGTSLPQKEALAGLNNYIKNIILFFGIGGLLLIVIVYLLSKYMLKSIPHMTKVIKQLATGNLTPRLRPRSQDELGQVATDINTMIDSFTETINQVNDSVEQLAASSQQLTAISDESAKFSNEVATSTQEIVRGTEQQMEGAEQTSSSMEEMASGVQKVAESATNVSEQTSTSAKEAVEGYNNIQRAIDQMERIKSSVGVVSREIKKLEEHSKAINEMVSGITNIAEQTQLLSLNASIEAARAGEHGKGFAVVATEVKQLSEESQEFSSRIAGIIREVQTVTMSASKLMNQGVLDVDKGSAILDTAGSAFKQMTNSFHSIADQVSEVSAATEEISAGTEEVTAAMSDISEVTQGSFEHTKGIASAAEKQLTFMDEISSSAKTLSEMAEELKTALTTFKTNK
ncbi:methyl-accepting chemotaxis protein [Pseudobacillus sp. 179-B 2D1 NHS]|uniref:methyl-accepting chemotaxis protein n=1 Tax=Pseudobacillus sp. 179-B 2D1 NHS TaxID=3374292 RepID=UPI0038799FC1